jgi:hypothetical protein
MHLALKPIYYREAYMMRCSHQLNKCNGCHREQNRMVGQVWRYLVAILVKLAPRPMPEVLLDSATFGPNNAKSEPQMHHLLDSAMWVRH